MGFHGGHPRRVREARRCCRPWYGDRILRLGTEFGWDVNDRHRRSMGFTSAENRHRYKLSGSSAFPHSLRRRSSAVQASV